MNKKFKTLVLVPSLLTTLIGGTTAATIITVNKQSAASNDVEIQAAVTSNLLDILESPLRIESKVTFGYETGGVTSLTLIDEISEEKRCSIIEYNGIVLQDTRLSKSATGEASQQFLGIDNKVNSYKLTDANNEPVIYDDVYGNPFLNLLNLSNKQFNAYFDITVTDEGGYCLVPNDFGLGVITTTLSTFIMDFDGYIWDNNTLAYEISDFELIIEDDGTPQSMKFNKTKKDRFGSYTDKVESILTPIDEVTPLEPKVGTLTEEQKSTFTSNLTALQESLNVGNFTQSIKNSILVPGTNQGLITSYDNVYNCDAGHDYVPPMMLSTLPLHDQQYGETFIGIVKTTEGFQKHAYSPASGQDASLGNVFYANPIEFVPQIGKISPEFFTYKNGAYVFDIANYEHNYTLFAVDILVSLFTDLDPIVTYGGLYISNSDYDFKELSIRFSSTGLPTITLKYNYNGLDANTVTSFYNIGSTDITSIDKLTPVIDFIIYG